MPGLLEEYKEQQTRSLSGYLKSQKSRIEDIRDAAKKKKIF